MPKYRTLAPLTLITVGGLLIMGTLAMAILIPQQAVPTSATPPTEDYPDDGIPRVSVGDAKAAFDLKQAVFIDVRSEASYQQQHIPGALSIPWQELESSLDELDPQQWIITYCT